VILRARVLFTLTRDGDKNVFFSIRDFENKRKETRASAHDENDDVSKLSLLLCVSVVAVGRF